MNQGIAELTEIYLNGKAAGRIRCDPRLIPAPGQYLLAYSASESDAPLAHPVFKSGLCPDGFYAAPPLPTGWLPGTRLNIRGPLGKGFTLPARARFIVLAAFSLNSTRLLTLAESALAQRAAIVLLTDNPPDDLPAAIEISPLAMLAETLRWADYLALDLPQAAVPTLKALIGKSYSGDGQALIETPISCGGMGECGVCAVSLQTGFQLTCKDGPVFDLKILLK